MNDPVVNDHLVRDRSPKVKGWVVLGGLILLFWALKSAYAVFMPIAASAFLVALVHPLYGWTEARTHRVVGFLAAFLTVLLGFAPSVVLALVVLALGNADHLEIKYLVLTLLATLVVAGVAFAQLIPEADFAALLGLNFVLGALYIIVIEQSYAHHTEDLGGDVVEVDVDERALSSLFADLEQKAKSINTSIGRTYSVYKGASAGMREKIKIQHALYTQLDPEKKHGALRDAVKEIEGRLALLEQPEDQVFTDAEMDKLGRAGAKRVIDVLADNDGDGVLQTHASARSLAQTALQRL